MTQRISQAGPEALADVRQTLVAANDQYRAVLDPAVFDAYMAMVLDLEARLAVSQLLVCRDGDAVIGTVTFFPDARDEGWGGEPGVAGIRAMGVDPAAQGRGVGAALVAECVRRAADAGARALALHTADWLPAAIHLYTRCGFVRDPGRDLHAIDLLDVAAADDFVALAYRLDLDAYTR